MRRCVASRRRFAIVGRMRKRPAWKHGAALVAALVATIAATCIAAPTARAQLAVPPVPLPDVRLPGVDAGATVDRTLRTVDGTLANARRLRIDGLLRTQRARVDTDRSGAPIVRSEVLALDPAPEALARARTRGYEVVRESRLAELDAHVVVLRAPPGWSTARALRVLRELDAAGSYEFNHLYFETGRVDGGAPGAAMPAIASTPPDAGAIRIGMIDGGIDAAHPALAGLAIEHHGCDGRRVPSTHGTAVASLLAGRAADFQGAAPGATLLVADVYCGAPVGGAADAVAAALGWVAQQRATVVNVSLVGPPNRVVERVVARVLARGHAIVAAVGNDGPAAPPLYPAAYPGVIAVTAVDARPRALPEACRGPHVAFAAPGADLAAADTRGGYAKVRGTSFAAPLVTGLVALELRAREPANARPVSTTDVARDGGTAASVAGAAVAALAAQARDLGADGRDRVYGYGLVGAHLRRELAGIGAMPAASATR